MTIPKTDTYKCTCGCRGIDTVTFVTFETTEKRKGNKSGEPKHHRQAINSKCNLLVEEPANRSVGACVGGSGGDKEVESE